MSEQSHKDDMRAALRGDFERMRARHEDRSEPEAAPAAPAPVAPAAPPVVEPALDPGTPSRGSWLGRLSSRHRAKVR